jgi:hypothetical protein
VLKSVVATVCEVDVKRLSERREGRSVASWRAVRRSGGISRNMLSGDNVRRNVGTVKAKDAGKCKRAGQSMQWRSKAKEKRDRIYRGDQCRYRV